MVEMTYGLDYINVETLTASATTPIHHIHGGDNHSQYTLYRKLSLWDYIDLHLLYWGSILTCSCEIATNIQCFIDEFNTNETILILSYDEDVLDFLEELNGAPL